MFNQRADALRLASDFENRSPTDRIDLLDLLIIEGHADLVASGPFGGLELEIHGVNATGGTPWELIDSWCAMVDRLGEDAT